MSRQVVEIATVTGSAQRQDQTGQDKMAEGRAAGARAWVVKPFQPPQLLDAVAKLILP